ncbi:hypothetical protein O3G_MSEX007252 [Manduca sexta]|uniref:Chitin-binding type-2 domain-containing protein n=1 Tax=Manduca sexta TaxID=7130 RepID=A0A921Z7H4_MANSE|nr:hypothetical protein O3G_MSEX007252 [Manduca sexta]KAG6451608.1 hypothetical protein O3G_MSEX007252 [Manduca sexta]
MLEKLLFLALVASVMGRPDVSRSLYKPSDLCPPRHEHHLIHHEYDCKKFYHCKFGMKEIYPKDCAPGTEFAYELQICHYPHIAQCKLSGAHNDRPKTETWEQSNVDISATNVSTIVPPSTNVSTVLPPATNISTVVPPAINNSTYGHRLQTFLP